MTMDAKMCLAAFCGTLMMVNGLGADTYELMTGVDAGKYPGTGRSVTGSPGFTSTFFDGDRLAGTTQQINASQVGPNDVSWRGKGTPRFATNQFGSLSFLYRRGSIPVASSNLPTMGIEFLGGPLLDLDGDKTNGQRRLTAVPDAGGTFKQPVGLDRDSFIDLSVNTSGRTIELNHLDATGTNAGGANLPPEFGVTVNTLAGTSSSGTPGSAINPQTDDRSGTLSQVAGTSGTLDGVYRVEGLGYEIWNDSISHNTSTPGLGTFQFLGEFRGYVIEREASTGQFPTMSGEGLGTTLWPDVAASADGNTVTSATGGGGVTVGDGPDTDPFDGEGAALSDFGGDIGGYLDFLSSVADPQADRIVFLESAGFGVNNSVDPVFLDSVSYDAVIVAEHIIPEPSTGAWAAMGSLGLALGGRGRRRKA